MAKAIVHNVRAVLSLFGVALAKRTSAAKYATTPSTDLACTATTRHTIGMIARRITGVSLAVAKGATAATPLQSPTDALTVHRGVEAALWQRVSVRAAAQTRIA